MFVSKELLEKEKEDFLILKQGIIDKFGFETSDEDEIEESLKYLLAIESETFDNSMNDLVLKRYYEYFLVYIYPQIQNLLEANVNGNSSLSLKLMFDKIKINRDVQKAFAYALNDYCYQIGDDYLLNYLNSHEALLSEKNEEIISCRDLFQVKDDNDSKYRTQYPPIEYNYDPEYWKAYVNSIRNDLIELNKKLEDKIPDFSQKLELYEQHIGLYKEYIKKYRFLEATKEVESKTK